MRISNRKGLTVGGGACQSRLDTRTSRQAHLSGRAAKVRVLERAVHGLLRRRQQLRLRHQAIDQAQLAHAIAGSVSCWRCGSSPDARHEVVACKSSRVSTPGVNAQRDRSCKRRQLLCICSDMSQIQTREFFGPILGIQAVAVDVISSRNAGLQPSSRQRIRKNPGRLQTMCSMWVDIQQ